MAIEGIVKVVVGGDKCRKYSPDDTVDSYTYIINPRRACAERVTVAVSWGVSPCNLY